MKLAVQRIIYGVKCCTEFVTLLKNGVIALSRGGIDKTHFTKVKEFHSWGFPENKREVFDICAINGIVYFHKYLPKALNCFWETFATHRKMCSKNWLSPEDQQINNAVLLCKVIVPSVPKNTDAQNSGDMHTDALNILGTGYAIYRIFWSCLSSAHS